MTVYAGRGHSTEALGEISQTYSAKTLFIGFYQSYRISIEKLCLTPPSNPRFHSSRSYPPWSLEVCMAGQSSHSFSQ